MKAIRFYTCLLALVVGLVGLTGCAARDANGSDGKIGVVVTILPQVEFVESVGGDKVDVTVMVPPGESLHTYEPTPNQMMALARAKIYAKVGSGLQFELLWMDQLVDVNEKMLVVDGSTGVQLVEMTGGETHQGEGQETEGEGGDPGDMDPHIWMSPLNVKIMVRNISDGLVEFDPGNRAYYEENRDVYLQKLTELDADIREGLAGVLNRRFMVYHPSFGYFAREYNLSMLIIEELGKEPTGAELAHLIEQAREYGIKVIFASPQFDRKSADVVAREIGGEVVFVDSLAGEYVANMRTFLTQLVGAME